METAKQRPAKTASSDVIIWDEYKKERGTVNQAMPTDIGNVPKGFGVKWVTHPRHDGGAALTRALSNGWMIVREEHVTDRGTDPNKLYCPYYRVDTANRVCFGEDDLVLLIASKGVIEDIKRDALTKFDSLIQLGERVEDGYTQELKEEADEEVYE